MKRFLLASILLLTLAGCATAHRPITEANHKLGAPHLQCDINGNCSVAQNWVSPDCDPKTNPKACEVAQLTPFGCAVHFVVTLGHRAMECRKDGKRGGWR